MSADLWAGVLPVAGVFVLALLVAILMKLVLTAAPLHGGSALGLVRREIERDRWDWNARPRRWWKFWRRRGRNAYRKI
jgi:hypothetical protein